MNLSLRTQLLLWFGLAVILIAFGVTFLTEEVTVWNMERAMDDALQKRAHMVAAIVSSDITTDEASYIQVMNELAQQELPFAPLILRLVSPSGKTIIEFGKVTDPVIKKLDYQWQLPGVSSGRFDNIAIEGLEPVRVYSVSVSDPRTRQTLAVVQAAESLSQLEETKRQLWRNGIIVGLAGSLLSVVIGLFLIRRGFRPLHSILQTIDKVDYYHLKTSMQKEARPAELEQLAKSLTAMWQRLDTAIDEKQRLVGGVSHDLRTPLTVLQGELEVFLLKPSLTAEERDSIEGMLGETRRLTRLVRNLLLNVQLESKPALVTEEVNLRELLKEVVTDMWILSEGRQFNVVSKKDIEVYGDHDLLKQMLLNIVDNAIKYTPKGGKVELMLTTEDEWAVLEVSDTGRGIPREDLPHVTEAFYTSRTSRRSVAEGVGLGLSIVKQIAELHDGQLEIQSEEKVGTSVRVRLPRRLLIVLPEHK